MFIGVEFPTELEADETFGPLTAVVSPEDAAANMTFLWDFGNGRIASAPKTGFASYDSEGSYTVTLTGTDSVTGANVSTICGTVKVGAATAAIIAECSEAPVDTTLKFIDAEPGDR